MSSAGLTIVANVAIAMGPAVLCVKFVLYYMQGHIAEFRCPRQALRKGSYILHMTQKLYSLKAS